MFALGTRLIAAMKLHVAVAEESFNGVWCFNFARFQSVFLPRHLLLSPSGLLADPNSMPTYFLRFYMQSEQELAGPAVDGGCCY
jgi:hypothetical protein